MLPHEPPAPNTVADTLGMARLAQDIERFQHDLKREAGFPWQVVCFAMAGLLLAMGGWFLKDQASMIKEMQKVQEQRTLELAELRHLIRENTTRIDGMEKVYDRMTTNMTQRILAINRRVDGIPGVKREELP